MVRDSERNTSLYEIARRTQEEQGLPIIVVFIAGQFRESA